jgi:DNA-binding CsgD family transcriptional regulator
MTTALTDVEEGQELGLQSAQSRGSNSVLLQLEGRTYQVIRACDSEIQRCGVNVPSSPGGGERPICGWLRINYHVYVVVPETDDRGGPDRPGAQEEPWETLSEREAQIALLVSRGKGTKQIAGHLLISEHTVRSYMRRIFSKLRVSTRPAMVAQLMRAGVAIAEFGEVSANERGEERVRR